MTDLSGLPSDGSCCPEAPADGTTAVGGLRCCGAPAAPAASPSAGWDSMADWYTQWMSPGTASVATSLYGHLGLLQPAPAAAMRVLETHCGDARAAAGLVPSPAVAAYTAADYSEGMLAKAKANLGGLSPQARLLPLAVAATSRSQGTCFALKTCSKTRENSSDCSVAAAGR